MGGIGLHVAWSEDGGASWRRASNAPADCINVSEVAIAHDTPYVVCAGFRPKERNADYQRQNPFTGLRVYRLDPSGALRLVTTLDAFRGAWPHLLATRDGELILAANVYGWFQKARWFHHCCAAMARSADGQVWSAPLDLRPLVATPARPDIMVLAARLDAEGLLHLLAIGHGTKADSAPRAGGGIGLKGRILHLVLDPTAGRLIGESVLSGELSPAVDSGGQTNVAMTFRGDMGLVAWNEGRTLYVARIEPAGEGGH